MQRLDDANHPVKLEASLGGFSVSPCRLAQTDNRQACPRHQIHISLQTLVRLIFVIMSCPYKRVTDFSHD